MRAIFISYRRNDSEGEAGRLFDDLATHFGEPSVFMDVAAIDVGRDFRHAIDESVATCGVLLALIGPGWLDEKDNAGKRRLDDPGDFVRLETASALKRDIPVIPVLLRGAKMPQTDQLPSDLKDLAYRNCVELTHVRWKSDVKVLVGSLRQLLGRDAAEFGEGTPRTTQSKPAASAEPLPATAPQMASGAHAAASSAATPSANIPCAGNLDADSLSIITKELAHYIGPIAEIVVRRASRTYKTISDLRGAVAEEIEVSGDRAKFLQACRDR